MSFEEFQDGHSGSYLGYQNRTILAILSLYVPPNLPSSFSSIQLTVWEEISFEEFPDGGHLGYWNGKLLAVLNLYVLRCLQLGFGSIQLTVWEEMSSEEFQDSDHGGHLGYQNGMI